VSARRHRYSILHATDIILKICNCVLLLLMPMTTAGVKRLFNLSVSVCLFVHSITQKRMIPKSSNFGYHTSVMVLELKGQRSRLQCRKVQKHIEGDRVAGVSLHLY